MKPWKVFLFVLLAIALGIAVAVYRIADFEHSNAFFRNGNWMGSKDMPLGKDDLLTAQITCFALFALPGQEAIYLFAKRDNTGEKFHSKHDYVIRGNVHDIHAKYWSITAYGSDLFLIPNTENKYSFNNTNIQAEDSLGNFSIKLSSRSQEGNWLPTPEDARFNLVLRIYRGDADYIARLDSSRLPEIKLAENE